MQNELIIISEYCDKCHIEPSFIEMLQEGGLIDIRTEDGERCLLFSQLPDVERYSRMYYDLSINIEGIDAIHHLLASYRYHAFAFSVSFIISSPINIYKNSTDWQGNKLP